ncbi:hypothetical protein Tco_1117071 [Tanacetum coccineum]
MDDNKCPWVVLVSKIKNKETWQSKAFRAKQAAETKLMGDYALQYKMLRDYVLELQESNPNTTVKIHVQSESNHEVPTRVFKRIYVCLGPLKAGFKGEALLSQRKQPLLQDLQQPKTKGKHQQLLVE